MKDNNTKPQIHKTKIGGQALYNGVMMRGPEAEAMAVRKKNGEIYTESKPVPKNKWYQKTPFIRGVFNFILQLKNGYTYLMKSFEISGFFDELEEEENEKQKQKQKNNNKTDFDTSPKTEIQPEKTAPKSSEGGEKSSPLETIITVLGMIGGIAISMFLFMFLPAFGFTLFSKLFEGNIDVFQSLFEGIIRIILLVGYMWIVSLMKEIRITYECHGAEHKTIAAYEAGETLDPENVKPLMKYSRFHPRCGTSFIFLVMIVSILVYSIIQTFLPISSGDIMNWLGVNSVVASIIRSGVKILLLPFLVGITYEVIRLAGRYDKNIIMRIISAPGLALQRLTTFEPTEEQMEVAVRAMLPVIPKNKEDDKW